MHEKYKNVGIIGKQDAPAIKDTITKLANFLLAHKFSVFANNHAHQYLESKEVRLIHEDQFGEECDLAIVVGGDGTILHAARSLCNHQVPIIGVNEGRLGFLVDISPHEIVKRMEEILLRGEYVSEERFLLHAEVVREGNKIAEGIAFNDMIVHKWNMARMIEFDTYVDDKLLNSQRSDGLIISTPTGSTAYALSGGGPLMHPTLQAMVLVPICPHTLTNRPIVVSDQCVIKIIINDIYKDHAQLACDGQINVPLVEHDHIYIRRKPECVTLIHPTDHDHFEVLRAKLRWG